MKLDVTEVINDLDGKPIPAADQQGNLTGGPLTVRHVLKTALTTRVQSEKGEYKDQLDRFILAMQVVQNDEVELDAKQAVDLKTWVAARYSPIVTGPICLLLEGKAANVVPGEKDAPDEV